MLMLSGCEEVLLPMGDTITASGTYIELYQTATECDSLVYYDVTIKPSYEATTQLSGCDAIFLPNNVLVTTSGTYDVLFQTIEGCDSLIHYEVVINQSDFTAGCISICAGDSITFDGETITQSGDYTAMFENQYGCDSIVNLCLIVMPSPEILLTETPASCGLENGSITATILSTDSITFIDWSNSFFDTTFIDELSAGSYAIEVETALGCSSSESIIVEELSALIIDAELIQPICNGDTNGTIILQVTGGEEPYSYEWSNNSTDSYLNDIPAGSYSVTVVDATGCATEASYTINDYESLEIVSEVTPVDCDGDPNGAIDLTISGGVGDYNILWNTTSTNEDMTGLVAGTYLVTVTDENSCTNTHAVLVSENGCEIWGQLNGVRIMVSLCSLGTFEFQMEVFDTFGKSVWKENRTATNGKFDEIIDFSHLRTGNYIIIVTAENASINAVEKFTVIN